MWIDEKIVEHCHEDSYWDVWIPKQPLVVLGRSNQAAIEVETEFCSKAQIPVFQRSGGGGTVVLYPGCVIIGFGCWVKDYYKNKSYFFKINQAVIEALALNFPELAYLQQGGISDLTFDNRKVGGTSLFRSRNYLLYQASLIVNLDINLLSSCLKHPSREPEYRRGRNHSLFMTSLAEICSVTPESVVKALRKGLDTQLRKQLESEKLSCQVNQTSHLLKRFGLTQSKAFV